MTIVETAKTLAAYLLNLELRWSFDKESGACCAYVYDDVLKVHKRSIVYADMTLLSETYEVVSIMAPLKWYIHRCGARERLLEPIIEPLYEALRARRHNGLLEQLLAYCEMATKYDETVLQDG
jgi:hypothetical protein